MRVIRVSSLYDKLGPLRFLLLTACWTNGKHDENSDAEGLCDDECRLSELFHDVLSCLRPLTAAAMVERKLRHSINGRGVRNLG